MTATENQHRCNYEYTFGFDTWPTLRPHHFANKQYSLQTYIHTHSLSTFQPVLSLIPWSFGQYHKMFNILHSIYSLQTFWWINFLIMKPKNSSRDFWCRLSNLPRFTFDVDFHLNKQRSSRSSSSSNRSTNNSTQFSSTVFSRLIESLKTLANNRLYNCCYIYAVWFHPKIDDCFFSYHRFQCGNRKNQIEFD